MSCVHFVRNCACAEDVGDDVILCVSRSCVRVRACVCVFVCCAAAWHGQKRRLAEEALRQRGVDGSARCHGDTDVNTHDDPSPSIHHTHAPPLTTCARGGNGRAGLAAAGEDYVQACNRGGGG
jgi:hypothetical protein